MSIDSFQMVSEVTAIDLTTLRRRTECSYAAQFTEKQEVGSPGRIRTYSLSVNSLVPDLITIVPEPRQIEGIEQVLIKWG
jgi:hypothetical protein